MKLEKYSLGIGDRFGREGAAQLEAIQKALALGISIAPVWNKSNREHAIIGTSPDDTRRSADEAVRVSRWTKSYYVDADHIGLGTVDRFLISSNYYTIDVADYIGKPAGAGEIESFVKKMSRFQGRTLQIPRMKSSFEVTAAGLTEFARRYLLAVVEAGKVYRHIAGQKGADNFVTEISVDESNSPQSPADLFLILGAVAGEGIPIQTIAPKFSGAFLKGIDYVGDVRRFSAEFEDDLAVIAFAIGEFGLPENLKLSVHSGSDKFSLYPLIREAINKCDAGLHLKTAGTTWLEEIIGLAASGGKGLEVAKEVYRIAFERRDELCGPYRTVIDIDERRLPHPREVEAWSAADYVGTLRHEQSCERFNVHFRQLVHVGYKVAAEMGARFLALLDEDRVEIARNVTANIFDRHIQPLFLGTKQATGSAVKSASRAKRIDLPI